MITNVLPPLYGSQCSCYFHYKVHHHCHVYFWLRGFGDHHNHILVSLVKFRHITNFTTFEGAWQCFGGIRLSVCLSVCLSFCNTITFESIERKKVHFWSVRASSADKVQVRMKVIGSRSSGQGHWVKVIGSRSSGQGHRVKVIKSMSLGQGHRVNVIGSRSSGQGHRVKVKVTAATMCQIPAIWNVSRMIFSTGEHVRGLGTKVPSGSRNRAPVGEGSGDEAPGSRRQVVKIHKYFVYTERFTVTVTTNAQNHFTTFPGEGCTCKCLSWPCRGRPY